MEVEGRLTEFGSSLKVPNVQEMAKGKLSSVPARYVRHDPDHPTLSDTSSLPEIPVIDMEKLLDSATMESELQRMHNACQEWGFFQKERLSVATFLNADLNGDVGPAPSILSPENPLKFKRIGAADYMKGLFSREPIGKTYLDDMRI
ncbi:(S)-norcoclaurine synthase [Handroanthus impetiginosus]|uniref:(S)-norcoclaurine synthase n=1 Tax=Handroanthus impetiginosus TaxID=429701 RepID=A0A2G9GHQ6_9LAMI|nr:(S)-norcoclaurine synthase [Handroanthus impetiginosus]